MSCISAPWCWLEQEVRSHSCRIFTVATLLCGEDIPWSRNQQSAQGLLPSLLVGALRSAGKVQGASQSAQLHPASFWKGVEASKCNIEFPPPHTPPLSAVSVTCGQPLSENIKWKIPEIKQFIGFNCVPFWVVWWNLMLSCPGCKSPLCPVYPPPAHWKWRC